MSKKIIIVFFFLLCSSIAYSQQASSPDVEIALQKYTAQVNAKIDTQVNRLENAMQTNMETAKNQLKEEMGKEIKSYLKGVAIGIIGLIVVTLSIFRIVELKLNHTARIKRYEKELQESKANYDNMVTEMNMYQIELVAYKNQLDQISASLQSIGYNTPPSPNLNIKTNKKPFKVIFAILIILVVIIIASIVFIYLPNIINFFKTAQSQVPQIKVGN